MHGIHRSGAVLVAAVLASCSADEPLGERSFVPAHVSAAPLRASVCVSSHLELGTSATAAAARAAEIGSLREAGVGCIRRDFLWSDIEPVKGTYHFGALDQAIKELRAAEIETLALLAYSVAWAERSPGNNGSIRPEDFAAFASAVAAHFKGAVPAYEIWNEPNWANFWQPEPDPKAYAALLEQSADAIRKRDPVAKIVLGGNLSVPGMLAGDLWGFLKQLFGVDADVGDDFDVLSYHAYTRLQIESPESGDGSDHWPSLVAMTGRLREAETSLPRPAPRPIWNTETGWASYNVGEHDQALYLVRAILISAALGVERFYVYTTFDAKPNDAAPLPAESYYGLLGYDADPLTDPPPRKKPAFLALKALLARLGEAYVVGDGAGLPDKDGAFLIPFTDGKATYMKVAWSTDPKVTRLLSAPPRGWAFEKAATLVGGKPRPPTNNEFAIDEEPLVITYRRN